MLLNWLLRILLLLFAPAIILAAYPPDAWHDDRPWPGHRCDGQYDKRIADAWPKKSNFFSVLNPNVFDNRWTYKSIPLQFNEENPSRFKGVFFQVSMGLMISVYTTSGNFDIIDARGRLVNEGVAVTSASNALSTSTSTESAAPPESTSPSASAAPPVWRAPDMGTMRMRMVEAMLGVRRQCIRRGQAGGQWAYGNTVLIRIERDDRDLFPRTCTALAQIGAQVVCTVQSGAQSGVRLGYNMRDGVCSLRRNGMTIPLTHFHVALPTLNHCAGVLGLGVTGSLLYLTGSQYVRPPGANHATQLAIQTELEQLNMKLDVIVQYIGGTLLVPQLGPAPNVGRRDAEKAGLHLDWTAPEPHREADGTVARES